MSVMTGVYRCPKTHKALRRVGDALIDDVGRVSYTVTQDVANLLRYASEESKEDRERLARLNAIALSRGCVQALREVYGEDAGLFRYVTDTSRAMFLELLPITPDACILEIGSGLGQFTSALAERAGHVCALEVVEEQAVFTLQRCVEAGQVNVSVAAGGDDCFLPYSDEVFDGVILNLVLEWCGMRNHDVSLGESQQRMLNEIYRVLRPGGFFFVATKNRFGLRLLMGHRDGHAHDLRFGHALPGWLMRFILRRMGKARPLGMLHSHRVFIQMLTNAGFRRVQSFWAVPDMRRPLRYIRADLTSIRQARREGGFDQASGRLLSRLMPLVPAVLVSHVAHGNVAIAFKDTA